MFPVVPRPMVPQPLPRRGLLPPREGLAYPRVRLDTRALYTPTWGEFIVLSATVADGTTVVVTSKLIHNPFRLESVSAQPTVNGIVGFTLRWGVTQGDVDPATVDALDSELVYGVHSNLAPGNVLGQGILFGAVATGAVIQRYPSRIVLVVQNAAGGDIAANLLANITHLCRSDEYPAGYAPAAA